MYSRRYSLNTRSFCCPLPVFLYRSDVPAEFSRWLRSAAILRCNSANDRRVPPQFLHRQSGIFFQHRPAEENQSCLESDSDSGDPLPPVRGCQRRSGEQRIPTDAGMYASKFVKALSSTLRPTHAAAADGTAIVFIGWTASPGSRTGTASGSASGCLSLGSKTIRNPMISDGFCNFFTCFLLGEISTTHTVTHTAK